MDKRRIGTTVTLLISLLLLLMLMFTSLPDVSTHASVLKSPLTIQNKLFIGGWTGGAYQTGVVGDLIQGTSGPNWEKTGSFSFDGNVIQLLSGKTYGIPALFARTNNGTRYNAGSLYVTSDGQSWTKVFTGTSSLAISQIALSADGNTIWAAMMSTIGNCDYPNISGPYGTSNGLNGVYHSSDGGNTFTQTYKAPCNADKAFQSEAASIAVSPANPNVIWYTNLTAFSSQGGPQRLFQSTDGGSSFDEIIAAVGDQPANVFPDPVDPNIAYFNSSNSTALLYKVSGASVTTLSPVTNPGYPSSPTVAINPLNTNELWAANNAALHHSTDGGLTWVDLSVNAHVVTIANNGTIWIGEGGGLYGGGTPNIFSSADDGVTWIDQSGNMNPNVLPNLGLYNVAIEAIQPATMTVPIPTDTPTNTSTPTLTPTPTVTSTPTLTPTPTVTSTPTLTPTPTVTPTTIPPTMAPPYTTSYYIQKEDPQAAFNLGCKARQMGQTGIVVLDFGAPVVLNNASSDDLTKFGVEFVPPADRTYIKLIDVRNIILEFARGYVYYCGDKIPYARQGMTPANLTIAGGVSNTQVGGRVVQDNPALTAGHGKAWANLMWSIKDELKNENLWPYINMAGAIDAEPDWSGPKATYSWVEDYNSVYLKAANDYFHKIPYYDFGSCDGCARKEQMCKNDVENSNCTITWATGITHVEEAFKISWQIQAGWPLPEIYTPAYAYEWYNIKHYASVIHSRNMEFKAVMTECGDSGCLRIPNNCYSDACPFDNHKWSSPLVNPNIQYSLTWKDYPWYDVDFDYDLPDIGNEDDVAPNLPPNQGWAALFEVISTRHPLLNPQPMPGTHYATTGIRSINNNENSDIQTYLPWSTDICKQGNNGCQ